MKISLLFILISISVVACSSSDEKNQEVLLTLDWYPNANHAGIYLKKIVLIYLSNLQHILQLF